MREAYLGSALVAFDDLLPCIEVQSEIDLKRVRRLAHIFRREGCSPHADSHRLASLCSPELLEQIRPHLLGGNAGTDLQKLPRGLSIAYLQGRHRLTAARGVLPPSQHFWPVDFYDATCSVPLTGPPESLH